MTDYNTLKVPELKKLLQEKSLPVAGNKADLIARLLEHDKAQEPAQPAAKTTAEDEIDWDDDDPATTTAPTEAAKPAEPAAPAPAPAAEDSKPAATADSTETPAVAATEAVSDAADTKEEPAAPKPDFSANLAASTADEEARKRAERAKRFGIVVDQSEEDKKKAERAARFGEEATNAPSISGLDSALPERRERKRGREGAGDQQRDAKRQSTDGRRGGGRFKGRDRRRQGGGGGGGGRGEGRQQNGGGAPRNILTDPAEKAKAEARAKRFGA